MQNTNEQNTPRPGAPKKERRCRELGQFRRFKPAGIRAQGLPKQLVYLDEFEAIRLCDLEGMSQIEAGGAMGISRGTVQRLLTSGRAKIAGALLRGEVLVINNTFDTINIVEEDDEEI